jgi:hypothetical protein
MNKLWTAGLILILLPPAPASAAALTCPTAPTRGWQGFRVEPTRVLRLKENEAPRPLGAVAGVSLYDGAPTEMADLVPDNPDAFGKAPLVWSLAGDPKREIWVVCRYRNTTAAFGKALPPGVRTCSVEGGPGKGFRISCK